MITPTFQTEMVKEEAGHTGAAGKILCAYSYVFSDTASSNPHLSTSLVLASSVASYKGFHDSVTFHLEIPEWSQDLNLSYL